MISAFHLSRRLVALTLAALLIAAPVGTALADDGSAPVPSAIAADVTIAGIPVGGMTAEAAEQRIRADFVLPSFAQIALDATGTVRYFDPATVLELDYQGLVADALSATGPIDIAPRYSVDTTAVASFVASAAAAVYRAPVSAARKVVRSRLKITPSSAGAKLDPSSTIAALRAALDAEIASGGSQQPTVTATMLELQPRYTVANIGKTILVVRHERNLYYYSGAKLVKRLRCAVGMRAYPTPLGKFKVIEKRRYPSWTNPGSAWARGMNSYIGPGFYNPLGVRALYLNSPGIRIHGTYKTWSMGQAASHGCIRLTNATVTWLYKRIPVRTPVWIVR